MPREPDRIDLQEAYDDLDAELYDLADEVAEAAGEADADVFERAGMVEQRMAGVQWLLDEYGEEATVTLGGLNTGEYAKVQDYTRDAANASVGGPSSTGGASLVFFVAAGLAAAPFFDGQTDFESRAAAVRDLPPQTTQWLESEIDERTTPTVDLGNGFAARVDQRMEE